MSSYSSEQFSSGSSRSSLTVIAVLIPLLIYEDGIRPFLSSLAFKYSLSSFTLPLALGFKS